MKVLSETSSESTEYIVFQLEEEYYGTKIQSIEKIIKYPSNVRFVPKLPQYIKGIIEFEEKIVPVIDFRYKLNIPTKSSSYPEQLIILFESYGHLYGLIAHSVFECKISDTSLKKGLENVPFRAKEYSDGTIRLFEEDFVKTEELVVLLNPDKIYQSIEKELKQLGNQ